MGCIGQKEIKLQREIQKLKTLLNNHKKQTKGLNQQIKKITSEKELLEEKIMDKQRRLGELFQSKQKLVIQAKSKNQKATEEFKLKIKMLQMQLSQSKIKYRQKNNQLVETRLKLEKLENQKLMAYQFKNDDKLKQTLQLKTNQAKNLKVKNQKLMLQLNKNRKFNTSSIIFQIDELQQQDYLKLSKNTSKKRSKLEVFQQNNKYSFFGLNKQIYIPLKDFKNSDFPSKMTERQSKTPNQKFIQKIKTQPQKTKFKQLVSLSNDKFQIPTTLFQIFMKLENKFVDKEFIKYNLEKQNSQWTKASWKPLGELVPQYKLFDLKGFHTSQVMQGSLGDCYFLSSLASIVSAFSSQVLQNLFVLNSRNKYEMFCVQFCICGQWIPVVIDDAFPHVPYFCSSSNQYVWAMVLQKAWAKINNGYKNVQQGNCSQALNALSDGICQELNQLNQNKLKELKIFLGQRDKNHKFAITTSVAKNVEKQNANNLGLITDHAYSVLQFVTIENKGGKVWDLVKLRNPWGKFIWKGRWSPQSKQWTKELKEKYKFKCGQGSFFMQQSDFLRFFKSIIYCEHRKGYNYQSIRIDLQKNHSSFILIYAHLNGEYIFSINQMTQRKARGKGWTNYKISPARIILTTQTHQFISSIYTHQNQKCTMKANLKQGIYLLNVKVSWLFQKKNTSVLSIYGPHKCELFLQKKEQHKAYFREMFMSKIKMDKAKAKNMNPQKFMKCQYFQDFNMKEGLGYFIIQNPSKISYEFEVQFKYKGMKKKLKQQRVRQNVVKLKSNSCQIFPFIINSTSYSFSNSMGITQL